MMNHMCEEEEFVELMNNVLLVAHALKQSKFMPGLDRLFQQHAVAGGDGIKRVGSNGFLAMAFGSNIAPAMLNGMQVLQCVEHCLGKTCNTPVRCNNSGLLIDEFVECIGRLAVEIFPGVSHNHAAELIMLQLDQSTKCLTQEGPIRPIHEKKFTWKPNEMEENAKESSRPPTPVRERVSLSPQKQRPGSGLIAAVRRPFSPEQIADTTTHATRPMSSSSTTRSRRASTGSGRKSMENFLQRMEQDKKHRDDKLERLRKREEDRIKGLDMSPPTSKGVTKARKSISKDEQEAASNRLHASRKTHFETKRAHYDEIMNCDSRTGQRLFTPKLLTAPKKGQVSVYRNSKRITSHHKMETSDVSSTNNKQQKENDRHDNHAEKNGKNLPVTEEHSEMASEQTTPNTPKRKPKAKETGPKVDRWSLLYQDAVEKHHAEKARLEALQVESRMLASASKMTDQSKQYFRTRLLQELQGKYQSACSSEEYIMTPSEANTFLCAILGLNQEELNGKHSNAERQKFAQSLTEFINETIKVIDEDGLGIITLAGFQSFLEKLVNEDDDNSEVVSKFRRQYLRQRAYSLGLNRPPPVHEFTFAPEINPKSRAIDSRRRKKQGLAKKERVEEMFERADILRKEIEAKRESTKDKDLEGCTFHPKISEYKKVPASEAGVDPTFDPSATHPDTPANKSRRSCSCCSGEAEKNKKEREVEELLEEESKLRESLATRRRRRKSCASSCSPPPPPNCLFTPRSTKSANSYARKSIHTTTTTTSSTSIYTSASSSRYYGTSSNREVETVDIEDWESLGSSSGMESPETNDDGLLLFVDVQLKDGPHRIAVYENENPRKIANRFSAIHGLSQNMEVQLTDHLTHLISDHCCPTKH